MALHWNFNEKAGTATEVQLCRDGKEHEFTLNLYSGNALLIALYEYTDEDGKDTYDLMWFFNGKEHAQNCLGLKKNLHGTQENMFGENGITQLTLYREYCRDWQLIVDLFAKAFPHITITILEKQPATEEGDDNVQQE